jgi:formamidase
MAIPVAIFDRDIMPNPEGLEKRDYGQCAIRSDGEFVSVRESQELRS